MCKTGWVCCLALALTASRVHASTEADRIAVLGKVWAEAEFLDPDVVFGSIAWEEALVRAIPKARAAKSDQELALAVGSMLAELHDPATRAVETSHDTSESNAPLSRTEGDVLVLNVGAYEGKNGSVWTALPSLVPQVRKAAAVVIDLRFHGEPGGAEDIAFGLASMGGFTADDVTGPSWDYVMHSGFAPEGGTTSGGYYSALLSIPGTRFAGTGGAAPARVAFVTDARTRLPDEAVALQSVGKAVIISRDSLDASALASTREVPLDGSWRAEVRVARPRIAVAANLVSEDPVADALAFARGAKHLPTAANVHVVGGGVPSARKPETYPQMVYPDVEHRIFAAVRLWSVINYFYPYKALIGDWNAVLPELLPRFIEAKDADQYAAAVLEMSARIEDGHTSVAGHPSVLKLFGQALFPATVRVVEKEFVVTRVSNDAANALHAGDRVVSVDGEALRTRVDRLRKYITASTERARTDRILAAALRGLPDSAAVVQVKGPDGALRTVRVARIAAPLRPPDAPPFKLLAGNIGYVDLTKLLPSQVDSMFDALMKTKAIIFDMRGYPNGTAWPIAPRINTKNAKVGAVFRRAEVSGTNSEETASGYTFEQELPTSDKPKYRGKTVMLIDDRAISQAEHTALFFEAANATTFIGSPTAGANGDVTNFFLPGGVRVFFTGHDVRHADGRQLQRVGIQPDIAVEPTIRGIREGQDEVLERAIAYLNRPVH